MRPQFLRAQGVYLQRHAGPDAALGVLRASADLARTQHALPEVGRTMVVLEQVARSNGNATLANAAAAERTEIVDRAVQRYGV